MFTRALICLLLLVSPASATFLIQDGDVYDDLWFLDDNVRMTGGIADSIKAGGTPNFIEGGAVRSFAFAGGSLTVTGGNIGGLSRSDEITGHWQPSTITVRGTYFRYRDAGRQNYNYAEIEGWLLDGSYISAHISNNLDCWTFGNPLCPSYLRNIIEVLPGPIPTFPGDSNNDRIVDLIDLNAVRNDFGGVGSGDTNHDGTVDLADLNDVRNLFGFDRRWRLGPEYEVQPLASSVPEPSAFVLMALALFLFSRSPSQYRLCQRPRRSP